jgi:hypothetical protein
VLAVLAVFPGFGAAIMHAELPVGQRYRSLTDETMAARFIGPVPGKAMLLCAPGRPGERQTEADGPGARGQVSTSDFPETSHD